MKLFKRLLIVLLFSVFNGEIKAADSSVKKTVLRNQENDPAVSFAFSFYKWYKTNFKKINSIYFIDMDLKNPNPAPYRVNFKNVDKYLSILQSAEFFSANYISYYRNYFESIDKILKKTKQDDGSVDGLDSDFFLHTQEPEYYLKDLSKLQMKVIKSKNSKLMLRVRAANDKNFNTLIYLSKVNSKFYIDKFDTTVAK